MTEDAPEPAAEEPDRAAGVRRAGAHRGRGGRRRCSTSVEGSRSVRSRSTSASSRPPTSSCAARSTAPDADARRRAARRLRLDAELVRRGLARSREHASELVAAGRVKVAGAVATKPATGVTTDVAIVVADDPDRARLRLARRAQAGRRAAAFGPPGSGSRAGAASTRARRPAASPTCCCATARPQVVAVDVGYGQLAWRCGRTSGSRVHDRTNVRELTPDADRRPGRPGRRRPVVHLADAGAATRCSA